jgi:glycogen synthase
MRFFFWHLTLPNFSKLKHIVFLQQVVLLGSAPDPRIQSDFINLAKKLHGEFDGRVKLCLTYDEPLSHLVSLRFSFSSPIH